MTGENALIEKIIDELAMLGIEHTAPAWRTGPPPDYPRGIGPTKLANPRWNGTASDRKRAAQLKRDYADAFDDDKNVKRRADVLLRELRADMRALDEAHNAALWATVREVFDYPVFVASDRPTPRRDRGPCRRLESTMSESSCSQERMGSTEAERRDIGSSEAVRKQGIAIKCRAATGT